MTDTSASSDTEFASLDTLAYANGQPLLRAAIKQQFADFCVDEELGFAFTGNGEHLYVQVRKTDMSTPDVAKRLSAVTGVPLHAIGYAGMKDRRAECSQWFSVQLSPPQEVRVTGIEDQSLSILDTQRNARKLKIGSHKQNHFRLRLRNCTDPAAFESRLQALSNSGLPNYFGQQRFGRDMSNLTQVQILMQQLLAGADAGGKEKSIPRQFKRGMLLSAARSYLFNQVLSQRIVCGNWNSYLPGDVLNLNGTDRCFTVDPAAGWDETLQLRLQSFDIHPTGPLAGIVESKDKYISRAEAADIEDAVLQNFPTLKQGLERCGLVAARRALRFVPANLGWSWQGPDILLLEFSLGRGCYATSLLRELCQLEAEIHPGNGGVESNSG